MKILHIVDSLSVNGRTILIQELTRNTNPSLEHLVITLMNTGALTHRFSEIGIEVHALNLYKPFRNLSQKRKTITRIFHFRPDVCLCWSGDANLISTIPRILGIPVIWTLHNSTTQWKTAAALYGVRLAAILSKFVPKKIICCSNKTFEIYRDIHRFKADKLQVITNGIDIKRFQPNKDARGKIRKQLGISDNAIVISTAARIASLGRRNQGDFKDIETLFKAAAIVCRHRQDASFLLFGLNLNYENEQLVGWLKAYDLQNNVQLLGFQDDVPGLFAASDIFTLSSTSGEGLPISLLEAMASGAIPVCTDSGDIRTVVDSAGFVVPQKDAAKLAEAILGIAKLNESQRAKYSKSAIEMVKNTYSIDLTTRQYIDVVAQAIGPSKKASC